jgi:integrase
MSEQRVKVWVQRFKDRPTLMLQWTDPETGKRKSQSAKTSDPAKAETARADLESDLNHGRYAEASRMTWERFRELFEEEYVGARRVKTRENYQTTLDLFESLCSPKTLRQVTGRTVSQFAAAMRQRNTRGRDGMAPGTVKVHLQFLHTALSWAAQQKLIPECPRFPVAKVPRKRPQPVPAESFEKLLAKAKDAEMRAYLLCGWLAGLRLSEAWALEREETDKAPWIDLGRQRIVLPAGFVKADEDQWVPLDPTLRAALEALPRRGARVFHFTHKRTGEPLSVKSMGERVSRLARAAGVRLTMHSLRKGFGCRHAGRVSAQVLQRLMRHSTIAVTMNYYANVDQAVEEAILGPQRNGSRNTRPEPENSPTVEGDVTLDPLESFGSNV